ncbi:serpin A12 [Perognathus longimembris pacificus]|uniref:serpin A12 n=1 Tax=Perognathus longimembris pacificus TaxID=214514 RepID=UPI002018B891|nr:serpin A12 [Perognathus longimembris pacificus]
MKLRLGLSLFLAGLLTAQSLQQPNFSSNHQGDQGQDLELKAKRNAQELGWRNMEFGFKLLKKLAYRNPRQNIFFSPLSISTAFSMLSLGAQDSTLAEIKRGLSFRDMADRDLHEGFRYLLKRLNQQKKNVQLDLGNALFIDRKLKAQRNFLRAAKGVYNAEMLATSFQNLKETRRQINGYISQKTHGKIHNLVRSIDPGTVMLLANYIFFQARWKYEFDPKKTKEEDFFVEGRKTVRVPMMFRSGMYDFAYDEQLACTILEMPYNGNITVTFILPDNGKMERLEEGLKVDIFSKWKSLLAKRVVDVFVPRLHLSGTYNLKKTLSELGISKVFEEHGDLTRISPYRSLKVGEAVHKAELKMDEKGTEGAAGSGVQTLPMEKPEKVRMNRPYVLLIYENITPSLIFLGKIVDPRH